MAWPDSNYASHANQRARENILAERARRHSEALDVELAKWPDRAIEAGTAAKLARHFTYFLMRAVSRGESLSW